MNENKKADRECPLDDFVIFHPYNALISFDSFMNGKVMMVGKIVGEYTKGFNLPSGGWVNEKGNFKDAIPAEYIIFIPKGKSKKRGIKKGGLTIERI